MKLIIAGGREYLLTDLDMQLLTSHFLPTVTEVVSGGATGADRGGERWAESMGIKVTRFPADWDNFGKAAGPIRNKKMAVYADSLALFPGGRGTTDMFNQAVLARLNIFDLRENVLVYHLFTEGKYKVFEKEVEDLTWKEKV